MTHHAKKDRISGHSESSDMIKISSPGRLRKYLDTTKRTTLPRSAASKEHNTLMVSVSGVRGVIGESLTPEVITRYTAAFGNWAGGTIVVGRDSRVSGEMVKSIVCGTLMAVGCKIVDIGVVPTPTVEIAVNDLEANGGIAITASHNPIQWNALKLIGPKGRFLTQDQLNEVLEIAAGTGRFASWDGLGKLGYYDHAIKNHIEKILDIGYIDINAIRTKGFRVVVDCVNGAGGTIVPQLLRELGCEAIVLNEEPHGVFPRNPEPAGENLHALAESVRQNGAAIGLAVDPDVDRLAIVSEKGVAIGEEMTLTIASDLILSKHLGHVVVNASTSRMVDDIAKKYGVTCHHTKIGEVNVSSKMEELDAVIGGEGNGGVILPDVHLGRDACTGIALTLQWLLEKNRPLSEAIEELPHYVMKKEKIELHHIDADAVIGRILHDNKNRKIDRTDGIKIILDRSWIHFRKSNTEPILRIIAEAPSEKELENLMRSFTSYFAQ